MATAAFKSTTRRTSMAAADDSSSISRSSATHRRSRSVSRFSHRLPPAAEEMTTMTPARSGKFVNTVRGSEFPEISLDDLAMEMFSSSASTAETASFRRRGRSASRSGGGGNGSYGGCGGGERVVSNGSLRRRRSLSAVSKYQICDSESDYFQKNIIQTEPKSVSNGCKQKSPGKKATGANQRRSLRRCSSQKDLLKSYDGYSSYSSVLTDDEARKDYFGANIEKTQAVYSQKTGKVKQSELADNGGLRSIDYDVLEAVSTVRRNYAAKLDQFEKRKHELLAQIMLEEERGKELREFVGESHPNPKENSAIRRLTRGRKRSNNTNRAPKHLAEEAEKIIEDFISSVEDTDISSIDGERSDTSSIFRGITTPMEHYREPETLLSRVPSDSCPGEMDGVVLPWLQWETSNDSNPSVQRDYKTSPVTPKTVLRDALEEVTPTEGKQSRFSESSRGSWSPDNFSIATGETSRGTEVESRKSQVLARVPRKPRVDVEEYLKAPSNEEMLYERWAQRHSISSGCLLMCGTSSFGTFLM